MSEEKSRKTRKRGIFQNYFIYIFCFHVIALAVTVVALLIANDPVTEFVHTLENRFPMYVRDITEDMDPESREKEFIGSYGNKIGNVTIESCGVNCDVYYGANRASMRNGVGFQSDKESLDHSEGIKLITGYDETYFSSLKFADIGDVIQVSTNNGEYQYRITDAKYIDADTQAYQAEDTDMLVLCSMPSVFSEHSGEYYYVFAQRMNGEGD